MDRRFEAGFSALFPERRPLYPDNFNHFAVAGRRVLITAAGGSIGSALARRILRAWPQRLILLDHSEQAIYELRREVSLQRPYKVEGCGLPVTESVAERTIALPFLAP